MIKITVELHSAITGRVTKLGEAAIWNDGTGTDRRGNYGAWYKGKRTWTRSGRTENFARQSRNVWELIHETLSSALGKDL